MFVAIPTAIPLEPFTNKLGNLAGKTCGSLPSPSYVSMKSTVSLFMSLTISSESFDNLASV